MLRALGIGLSKTGTTTLSEAFGILGLKCLDYDSKRLNEILAGRDLDPDFRIYDDVDAATDIPTALFYEELLLAYPGCKAILTIRDPDAWYRSVVSHYNERFPIRRPSLKDRLLAQFKIGAGKSEIRYHEFRTNMRNLVFGSVHASEFLYKKRFIEHNLLAQLRIPADRLLVMDITAGDGWDKLCPFLDLPVPTTPFPFRNKTDFVNKAHHRYWEAAAEAS